MSLPRAGSIAVYSWILESLSTKYPEYKDVTDFVFSHASDPRIFKNVAELFEEINLNNPLYKSVKKYNKYNDLEQSLMPQYYYYDLKLYETLSELQPLPVVSLKVGKSYAVMDNFIADEKYKTIVLTRKNLKQQFLSFIVATETQTYHGNQEKIFYKRERYNKIEIFPAMFEKWFDWLFKLHRIKQITDYTFYLEDIEANPNFLLNALGLPTINTHDKIIKKTKDTDFIKYIKNPDVFEKTWNEYMQIYKGMF